MVEYAQKHDPIPVRIKARLVAAVRRTKEACAHSVVHPFAIARHSNLDANYDLYSVGLIQPPSSGRVTAVRFGSQVPYLMVEARQRVDRFDSGIPSEGVIVYQVQTSNPFGWTQNGIAPVELLTTSALTPGMSYRSSGAQIVVTVNSPLPGGFRITISSTENPACVALRDQIAEANQKLADLSEIFRHGTPADKTDAGLRRQQLLAQIADLSRHPRKLGCRL